MKNTKIKNIAIRGEKYQMLNDHKQELGPIVGILFTLKDFESVLDEVVDLASIEKKDGDKEKLINQAIETYYMVNMMSKSYLMYIVSLIESKVLTFFNKHIINKINIKYPDTLMKDIPDEFWSELFRSRSSKGSFLSKYKVGKRDELPSKFFINLTLGHYIFILTRLNDDLVGEFFKSKFACEQTLVFKHIRESGKTKNEMKLATFRKALKIVKEFRNQVVHETLIINPTILSSVADKERADIPLATLEDKVQYIFDALNIVLSDIGYTQIGYRLSRHIDREIKDKNNLDFRKKKNAKLSLANLKLFNFYKKK